MNIQQRKRAAGAARQVKRRGLIAGLAALAAAGLGKLARPERAEAIDSSPLMVI